MAAWMYGPGSNTCCRLSNATVARAGHLENTYVSSSVPAVANPRTIRFGRWLYGHYMATARRHTCPMLMLVVTWATEGCWNCLKCSRMVLHLTANSLTADTMADLTSEIAAACRVVVQAARKGQGMPQEADTTMLLASCRLQASPKCSSADSP